MQDKQKPPRVSNQFLCNFHSEEYIEYIQNYFKEQENFDNVQKFGIGLNSDTPSFPDMISFCQLIGGTSLIASELLIQQKVDVVVNWMGGYHHAQRSKASGFCYINDIVLTIERMLTKFDRILYVDIDVHHGDGVEQAFYNSNKVLSLSVHQFDPETNFFPGTGDFGSDGVAEGKFHSVNVPLKPGCNDETFIELFDKIFDKVFQTFQPQAIYLQCGSDSLIGDSIGRFRLGTKAHGFAVQKVLKKGVPVILGGGGGYTVQNVARCWAYETSLACGVNLSDKLPQNLYYNSYYQNDPYLHIKDDKLVNDINDQISYWKFDEKNYPICAIYNNKEYSERLMNKVFQSIKYLQEIRDLKNLEINQLLQLKQ